MEQNFENANSAWTGAAKDGIYLALVTVVAQAINAFFPVPIVGTILWFAKLAGSIWLLLRFMKAFAASGHGSSVAGYGIKVCLFSSIICASFAFALYSFIKPELVTEAFEQIPAMLGGATLPDEAEDMLLKMEDNFAQYAFAGTLIWDFICGLLFSAILAGPAIQAVIVAGDGSQQANDNQEEEL